MVDGVAFHDQGTANERLWLAVIANAVEEWMQGPMRHERETEYFLFQDEDDFPFVCRSAGIDPEHLREILWGVRARFASDSTIHVA